MYLIIKHFDNNGIAKSYEDLVDFAEQEFNLNVTNNGYVKLKDKTYTVQYNMKEFSKKEVLVDFCNSNWFLDYAKSRYFTIFKGKIVN